MGELLMTSTAFMDDDSLIVWHWLWEEHHRRIPWEGAEPIDVDMKAIMQNAFENGLALHGCPITIGSIEIQSINGQACVRVSIDSESEKDVVPDSIIFDVAGQIVHADHKVFGPDEDRKAERYRKELTKKYGTPR